MVTRRHFTSTLGLAALAAARSLAQMPTNSALAAAPPPGAERKINLRVRMDGFGGASEADIKAVLRSAANELWQHCPDVRFEAPGFEIYHNEKYPITHFERSEDGWIVIGLAVEGNLWARFAFQFAHEFAHALMDHSNDWRRLWHKVEHANQWLEESICETSSLFCLRAMARTWKTAPPYPNWKDYATALASYAQERMDDPKHRLPGGQTFAAWFAAEEAGLRKAWAQREKNTIIAQQLLPLFETQPGGWEALPWLKRGTRDVNKPLAKHLAEWHSGAPAEQRAFIARLAEVFAVKI